MLLPYKNVTKSITMDNGTEFSEHSKVAKKLNVKTYFTHLYSSWEKGQVEYMNKLLRQYCLKNQTISKSITPIISKKYNTN